MSFTVERLGAGASNHRHVYRTSSNFGSNNGSASYGIGFAGASGNDGIVKDTMSELKSNGMIYVNDDTLIAGVPNIILADASTYKKRTGISAQMDRISASINSCMYKNMGLDNTTIGNMIVLTSWGTLMSSTPVSALTSMCRSICYNSAPTMSRQREYVILYHIIYGLPVQVPRNVTSAHIHGNVELKVTFTMFTLEPAISSSQLSLNAVDYGVLKANGSRNYTGTQHDDNIAYTYTWCSESLRMYNERCSVHDVLSTTTTGKTNIAPISILTDDGSRRISGRNALNVLDYYVHILQTVKSICDDKKGDNSNTLAYIAGLAAGNRLYESELVINKSMERIQESINDTIKTLNNGATSRCGGATVDDVINYATAKHTPNNDGIVLESMILFDRFKRDSSGKPISSNLEQLNMYPGSYRMHTIRKDMFIRKYPTFASQRNKIIELCKVELLYHCKVYADNLTNTKSPMYRVFDAAVKKYHKALLNDSLCAMMIYKHADSNIKYCIGSHTGVWFSMSSPNEPPIIMIPTAKTLSLLKRSNRSGCTSDVSSLTFSSPKCRKLENSSQDIRYYVGGGLKYTGIPKHYGCTLQLLIDALRNAIHSNLRSFIDTLQISHISKIDK